MAPAKKYPLPVSQSPAIDIETVPDETWVRDKTIVITGGACKFSFLEHCLPEYHIVKPQDLSREWKSSWDLFQYHDLIPEETF